MEPAKLMESYKTTGTCAKQIIFKVKDNILTECRFINGCSGNLQAVSRILVGQDIDMIIEKLQDIKCRNNTSCPAQLAAALQDYKTRMNASTTPE